jgi:hypothetical protein
MDLHMDPSEPEWLRIIASPSAKGGRSLAGAARRFDLSIAASQGDPECRALAASRSRLAWNYAKRREMLSPGCCGFGSF